MLTGEYQHNMDLKGRVTVPSKFREDLGDKFYVCKGLDGCLFLLSQAQWDKLVEKVSAIRKWIDERNPGCELEVDGGVDPVTRDVCVAAGANVLVAGSAVYKAADIPARIAELRG